MDISGSDNTQSATKSSAMMELEKLLREITTSGNSDSIKRILVLIEEIETEKQMLQEELRRKNERLGKEHVRRSATQVRLNEVTDAITAMTRIGCDCLDANKDQ